MNRLLLLSAVTLAISLSLVSGDGCTKVDSASYMKLYDHLSQRLRDSDKSYLSLKNGYFSILGFGVEYNGVKLGDFSDFDFDYAPQFAPATKCVSEGLSSFDLYLKLRNFEIRINNFTITTPYFRTGFEFGSFGLQDMKSTLYATKVSGTPCVCSMKSHFDEDTTVNISLGGGFLNRAIGEVANVLARHIVNHWGIADTISGLIDKQINSFISEIFLAENACNLI
ncbi:hypothetical protein GE061_019890 [Apolygus lucorum]|uniref:Uncharacterized protein n=1 Tax=Apolygus lucorum TaxID=248454 RepID=A0A6A4JL24_APOLU|nr:hypothetical protein GE061_019890 [Apolygus lucorum]